MDSCIVFQLTFLLRLLLFYDDITPFIMLSLRVYGTTLMLYYERDLGSLVITTLYFKYGYL